MWSLVPVSSLPSIGGTVGMPPVATRMCSACRWRAVVAFKLHGKAEMGKPVVATGMPQPAGQLLSSAGFKLCGVAEWAYLWWH